MVEEKMTTHTASIKFKKYVAGINLPILQKKTGQQTNKMNE